jgi:hypothetical protein
VEHLRAKDAAEPETGYSVRSEQAPRVWRVSDRLSEADLCRLVCCYRAGTTARELAEQFNISKSSVKRLLRERGVRRTAGTDAPPQPRDGADDCLRRGAMTRRFPFRAVRTAIPPDAPRN